MADEGSKKVLQSHADTISTPRALVTTLQRCQVSSCRESGKMKLRIHLHDRTEHIMCKTYAMMLKAAAGTVTDDVVQEILNDLGAGGP
eukprot:8807124-Heterocapsa_arctica.AAC.1